MLFERDLEQEEICSKMQEKQGKNRILANHWQIFLAGTCAQLP
jgi:hypothetical protein